MCGRYSIAIEPTEIEEAFHATFAEPFVKRYNAAPSQRLPVVLNEDPSRIVFAHWGLFPPWMKRAGRRDGLINIRTETLRDKATFKDALLNRRCLIVADGFYEWKPILGGPKIPYRIRAKDRSPLAFAGLWESSGGGERSDHEAFAIITTEANTLMKPIHNRMPVILAPEEKEEWLGAGRKVTALLEKLKPFQADDLEAFPISRAVNSARNDSPEVLRPAA